MTSRNARRLFAFLGMFLMLAFLASEVFARGGRGGGGRGGGGGRR
jgi:hypothetical protein